MLCGLGRSSTRATQSATSSWFSAVHPGLARAPWHEDWERHLAWEADPLFKLCRVPPRLNLRSYDPQLHDYIVFGNVNDMRFVLDYRALFQANTDLHTLGESRTGMYSYDV